MCDDHIIPHPIESLRHVAHSTLITTAVTKDYDVAKAVHLKTVGYIGEHRFERRLRHRYGTRARHVTRWRIDVPLWNKLDHWSAESIPELAGNRVTVSPKHEVMLTCGEEWSIRLYTPCRDKGGRLPTLESVADVHPRHLLNPDRVRSRKRIRRVHAVIHVASTITTAHRTWISLLLGVSCRRREQQDA